jgi:hypothetical protein
MQKRSIIVMLIMLMLATVFTLTCSRDDTAIVRIQLENMPKSTAVNTTSIFERVFRWFVTEAWAMAQPRWELPPTSIEGIISAPDLNDVSFSIPASERILTIGVPAGPSRRITVYAGKNYSREFGGHVELDLSPGDEVDAVINMVPITDITFAEPLDFPSRILLQWSVISPSYGVTGYKIHRSDLPAGPYFAVGSVSGVDNSMFEDTSGPFINGKFYYYRVSAYTDVSEGELSDHYGCEFYLS